MSYFDDLPEDVALILISKLIGTLEIYTIIYATNSDEDNTFYKICKVMNPFFRKFPKVILLGSRRIRWVNVYDNLIDKESWKTEDDIWVGFSQQNELFLLLTYDSLTNPSFYKLRRLMHSLDWIIHLNGNDMINHLIFCFKEIKSIDIRWNEYIDTIKNTYKKIMVYGMTYYVDTDGYEIYISKVPSGVYYKIECHGKLIGNNLANLSETDKVICKIKGYDFRS